MADNPEGTTEADLTFKVKASGDKNHTVTMSPTATVADLKTKLASEEFENIPIERQRLIYSGRVMKNEETLGSYKIKAGNTVHLVKSAASNPTPAPTSAAQQVPQALPNMAAGTTATDPLAQITGARYAGLGPILPNANVFGADGGMGAPPDESQLADMLSDPGVLQELARQLENPAVVDMMINSNPMLRDNPGARQMLNSPMFRQMLTNPDMIRAMGQMRREGGGPGAATAFPAPGATDNTPAGAPATGAAATGAAATGAQPNPFAAALGGGGAGAANPFMALLNPAGGQAGAQTPFGAVTPEMMQQVAQMMGNGAPPVGGAAANPFGLTPEMMQQAAAAFGGGGFGGGFGGGGFGAPAAPADTRPPEERYADQLQQLNEMGFFDFDQNVSALRRSGGNVQGAVNFLLGG